MSTPPSGVPTFATEPDPEFLAHLEWQVRSAARRAARFRKDSSGSTWRRLRAVAVLALTLCLGAGGVLAAQGLQRARAADLRAAQWQVRCALADAQLRLATTAFDEARAGFEAGARAADELAAAERARQRREYERARLQSELEEVAQTGREPSNRLSAPTVAARDFVRERLELEAVDAQAELAAGAQALELAAARHAAGVTSDDEVAEAELHRKQALGRQELVTRRLALRADFLAGRTSALAVELDELEAVAELTLQARREALASAREALVRAEARAAAGTLSQEELRSAGRRFLESGAALHLAELELDVLRTRDGPR